MPYCTVEGADMEEVNHPTVMTSGVAPREIQNCSGPGAAWENLATQAGSAAMPARVCGEGRGRRGREDSVREILLCSESLGVANANAQEFSGVQRA